MVLGIRGGKTHGAFMTIGDVAWIWIQTPTVRDMDTGQRQFYKNGNRTQYRNLYFNILK